MVAEAPIFVGQVFCFVKLKIILNTLHIFVRSSVFITLVLINRDMAIYAFGIAQFVSACVVVAGNYAFFYVYIRNLKAYRLAVEKITDANGAPAAQQFDPTYYKNMDDFPFGSILEMVPGVLPNKVRN